MKLHVGLKFGRWTILARGDLKGTNRYWLCRCDCGTERLVFGGNLTRGAHQSCGCLKSETSRRVFTTHGLAESAEYGVWEGIKQRCLNPNRRKFCIYGGRGITICERWRHSFENFIADMGPRPSPNHSIERRDNDGNYEPDNCYWATATEQGQNRRTTLKITHGGAEYSLKALCRRLGLNYGTVYARLFKRGWPIERALS